MSNLSKPQTIKAHSMLENEKFFAWGLGMVVAVAVFFQFHLFLPGGLINLNFADPFAALSLVAVSVHMLVSRKLPVWRIERFNLALGMISLMILLGFIRGWLEIGITQWALGGRLLGWLVLLGYLSAGYLIVANLGAHGLRRLADTLIATIAIVVVLQVTLRLLANWGINSGAQLTINFEGYAANRNAFAFQLLSVLTLLLGYSKVYARYSIISHYSGRSLVFSLLLGILLAGLAWSGSRTGILTGVVMLLLAGAGRLANYRILGLGLIFAAVFLFGVHLAEQEGPVNVQIQAEQRGQGKVQVQTNFSYEASDQKRLVVLRRGFDLWLQSPVLGAGLGVFHAKSQEWLGRPQVIENSLLWILAEFGLLGAGVCVWVFFLLAGHVFRYGMNSPARRILLLLLVAFSMFSLLHEIFFQRIFWLVLGAVLAQSPFPRGHT